MTSAFEKWGITHISNSQCLDFSDDMAAYIVKKLCGISSPGGAAMYRGNAVEAGVAAGLMNPDASVDRCVEIAVKEFERLTALSADPKRQEELAAIPAMVERALTELRPYGAPSDTQRKIEWKHPDISVPFIGFIDFLWEDHGIVLDLKTTHRMPGEVSPSHASQVALYCGAISDNIQGRVSYVTTKKSVTYHVENLRDHRNALVVIAQTMERFLSLGDTVEELAQWCVPGRNQNSFVWKDPRACAEAYRIWGYWPNNATPRA